jgi:hypothetical protein
LRELEVDLLIRSLHRGRSVFWKDGSEEYAVLKAQTISPENSLAVGDVIYLPSPPFQKPLFAVVVNLAVEAFCPFSWEYNNCSTCPYFKDFDCSLGKEISTRGIIKAACLVFEDEAEAFDFAEDYLKIREFIHSENLSLMHGARGDGWRDFIEVEDGKVKAFGFKTFHLRWVDEIAEEICRIDFDGKLIFPYSALLRVKVRRLG